MTNFEVANKIDELNAIIHKNMGVTFELNKEVAEAQKQIKKYQKLCSHKNEAGQLAITDGAHCLYCGKEVTRI